MFERSKGILYGTEDAWVTRIKLSDNMQISIRSNFEFNNA